MSARKETPGLRSLIQLGLLDRSVVEEGGNRRGIWKIIREQHKPATRDFKISCFTSANSSRVFQWVFFRAESCLCNKRNGHNSACQIYDGVATDESGVRSVLELTVEAVHQALLQAGKEVPAFELCADWAQRKGAYIVGDQAHGFQNDRKQGVLPLAHLIWSLHYNPQAAH